MTVKASWRVLDFGEVPESSATISFTCPKCGKDAELPVVGRALAQAAEGGVIFDTGKYALPTVIQCRFCRRKFEVAA
jgi:hypothetical protein